VEGPGWFITRIAVHIKAETNLEKLNLNWTPSVHISECDFRSKLFAIMPCLCVSSRLKLRQHLGDNSTAQQSQRVQDDISRDTKDSVTASQGHLLVNLGFEGNEVWLCRYWPQE
jgi:hypothetical protein